MSKLNEGSRLRTAPLQTGKTASGKTHEGAPGFLRDEKSELFIRATTVFAGEGSFYEEAAVADERAVGLVRKLAIEDWGWVKGFLPWLRSEANIRTMSIMLAAEAAQARFAANLDDKDIAALVDSVMLRADEPGEMAQYVLRTWGKFPRRRTEVGNKVTYHDHIKDGIALAAARLYNQTSVLRYDKDNVPMRFADVIDLTHPKPRVKAPEDLLDKLSAEELEEFDEDPQGAVRNWEETRTQQQSALFKYLLDERRHNDGSRDGLYVLNARHELNQLAPAQRHALAARALDDRDSGAASRIKAAAARQWEWVMSWLGEGAQGKVMDAALNPLTERQRWELVIPDMGYMALLRNLRNFDESGLSKSLKNKVKDKLADPEEVKDSRQLPFRFLSAHLNTHGASWLEALEEALSLSITNVPVLDGRTLILIDTSGSMQTPLSARPVARGRKPSTAIRPDRVKAAALFGLALALRNPGKVDVYGFADGNFRVDNIQYGASLLRTLDLFCGAVGRVGHGTQIAQNIQRTYDRHTRVALFTDMQAFSHAAGFGLGYGYGVGDVTNAVPKDVPVYAWNLAGYEHSAMATGSNRFELGGLGDSSFDIMQRLESGKSANWPWLKG